MNTNLKMANFFRCLKFTKIARGGSKLIKNWCLKQAVIFSVIKRTWPVKWLKHVWDNDHLKMIK